MEGSSFSTCRSTIAEQVWCPGSRQKQNVITGEASELSKSEPHISDRRKWQGIVVVGFHLQRTEAPICLLGLLSRMSSCLPGAQIQGVAEKPPRLSSYYSLLLIQVGTSDSARGDQERQEWLQGPETWGSGATDLPASLFPLQKSWTKAPWSTFLGPCRRWRWLGRVRMGSPMVSHTWTILLLSMIKWLDLWAKGEQWVTLTLLLALVSPFQYTLPSLNLKNKNDVILFCSISTS